MRHISFYMTSYNYRIIQLTAASKPSLKIDHKQ